MRRPLLLALFAIALCGCSGEKSSGYQGYVEGEYVYVASPVGGRLERLLVQRGQTVDAKVSLFNLEAEQESAAKQQADEQLKATEAQLADLKLGRRAPELEVARAQLAQARRRRAAGRDAAQARRGAARSRRHRAARRSTTRAQTSRSRRRGCASSRASSRSRGCRRARDQIRAQDAQVAAARAAVSQTSWRLDQKRPAATQGGLVVDTLYREGEWVPAGSPVVRMLPPRNIKVRFFVPETVAGSLKPGRNVLLRCDGCGTDVPAAVSYVADAPEFTPPIIYSNETRAKLVFMVEARPTPENATKLRPGQPVNVSLQ